MDKKERYLKYLNKFIVWAMGFGFFTGYFTKTALTDQDFLVISFCWVISIVGIVYLWWRMEIDEEFRLEVK